MAVLLDLLDSVTDEVLLRLSERNPGYQLERDADGRRVVSPTGGDGGWRSGEVFAQLWAWNRVCAAGVVFDSSTGFHLPDGSCLSPDASWVAGQRWAALSAQQRRGYPPLGPDVVFEVRSDTDSVDILRAKMTHYLAGGASVAVLVDPLQRAVEVDRPGCERERHQGSVAASLDPELPGFLLDPGPLFDA